MAKANKENKMKKSKLCVGEFACSSASCTKVRILRRCCRCWRTLILILCAEGGGAYNWGIAGMADLDVVRALDENDPNYVSDDENSPGEWFAGLVCV